MTKRIFEFLVIDRPIPMARKRVNAKGEKPQHYSVPNDVRSIYMIRRCFLEVYPTMDGNEAPISGPVRLSIRYFHKCPKTISMKKRQGMWMKPIVQTKPDIANLVAQACDALTGYAYTDDNQVAWLETLKFYAIAEDGSDTPPRMSITVEEL